MKNKFHSINEQNEYIEYFTCYAKYSIFLEILSLNSEKQAETMVEPSTPSTKLDF